MVAGSSPAGPTKQESRALRGFCVSGVAVLSAGPSLYHACSLPSALEPPLPALDEIDRQLIAALQLNARESVAMLARQLGIARTTVTSRLARLEKTQVITGYGVRLGQRVADGGLQAYVGITVQPRSGKEVLRRLSAMAQVQQLCAVSGEFDYVAWLRTDSPEQLDQLLDQIGSVDGVEKTTTSIILSNKLDRGQPV
ncbi:Lrp/AsnC family transcriptional regulator [Pseudomonas haemolytica]|uniref:Lrp/AsnC family transcriptional regulator n=1 Tax=Pseudomonas haemolytica TaxID=2600065 RepID=A0A646NVF6_9PSED|nr:Lrp/AsnC family transcriptional regulator [Pseudomonas haemolytica]